MEKIFYCKKCDSTWSAKPSDNLLCPDCKSPLIQTDISAEEWRTKSDEQKYAIKIRLKEESAKSDLINDKSNTYLENIAKDVHYMKTVLAVQVAIFFITLFFIFFFSFASCVEALV